MEKKSVKIEFREELRRLEITDSTTFESLANETSKLFNIPSNQLQFQYLDDENDWINLASTQELQFALQLFPKILRLRLKVKSQTLPSHPPNSLPTSSHSPQLLTPQAFYSQENDNIQPRFDHEPHGHHGHHGHYGHYGHGYRGHHGHHGHGYHRHHGHHGHRGYHSGHSSEDRCETRGKMAGRFVSHVTIPDDTKLEPGKHFIKTWRFRNESQSAWPIGCKLIFVGKLQGDKMGNLESVLVSKSPNPQEEVDVSVPLVAPEQSGRYIGHWRLMTPFGNKFGQRVRVQIQVVPPDSNSK